ncbi:MAG TPA: FHA domain-containing protein, partial [Verrucomicrobiae bacterium]
MIKLVVNPGTDQAWSMELREGIQSIGSSSTCDIILADPSVAERHAELHVFNGSATLVTPLPSGQLESQELIRDFPYRIGNVEVAISAEQAIEMPPAPIPPLLRPSETPFPPRPKLTKEAMAAPETTYLQDLWGAIRFPLSGTQGMIVIAGAIFFAVGDFITSFTGCIGFLIQLSLLGYLSAYAK